MMVETYIGIKWVDFVAMSAFLVGGTNDLCNKGIRVHALCLRRLQDQNHPEFSVIFRSQG